MDEGSGFPIGERVSFYRRRRGKSQEVLAGLAGITTSYLSQIERGHKIPTVGVLRGLARVLNVPVSALLGESEPDGKARSSGIDPSGVVRAFLGVADRDAEPQPPGTLQLRVDLAWRAWQRSPKRFTEVTAMLPALIADVGTAVKRPPATTAGRRAVLAASADAGFLLRTYWKRVGRIDLALIAADRASRDAREADDPLRLAAARWNLGHALLAAGQADVAEDIAANAIRELAAVADGGQADALAGALHLVWAMASARMGKEWDGRDRVREHAAPAARRCGDGNVFWTVFGPANLHLHGVSLEIAAGRHAEAIRLADKCASRLAASPARQATFTLELAYAHARAREHHAVLVHLLDVERLAPEELRYNPSAVELLVALRRHARPSLAAPVNALVERVGTTPESAPGTRTHS